MWPIILLNTHTNVILLVLQAANFFRGLFKQPQLEPKMVDVPAGLVTESNLHRARLTLVDFGRWVDLRMDCL